jgi:hypothetical protein
VMYLLAGRSAVLRSRRAAVSETLARACWDSRCSAASARRAPTPNRNLVLSGLSGCSSSTARGGRGEVIVLGGVLGFQSCHGVGMIVFIRPSSSMLAVRIWSRHRFPVAYQNDVRRTSGLPSPVSYAEGCLSATPDVAGYGVADRRRQQLNQRRARERMRRPSGRSSPTLDVCRQHSAHRWRRNASRPSRAAKFRRWRVLAQLESCAEHRRARFSRTRHRIETYHQPSDDGACLKVLSRG